MFFYGSVEDLQGLSEESVFYELGEEVGGDVGGGAGGEGGRVGQGGCFLQRPFQECVQVRLAF